MTTYYFDASALSKRYVLELGTDWVRSLLDPASGNVILTASITMVEIFSALARRKREGVVPAIDCDVAAQAFGQHCADDYDFVELNLEVVEIAKALLTEYPLRAYDAVQLASALAAEQALRAAKLPPLVFVSADFRLNEAARQTGLAVQDPSAKT